MRGTKGTNRDKSPFLPPGVQGQKGQTAYRPCPFVPPLVPGQLIGKNNETAHAPRTFKEARAAAFELAGRGYTVQYIAYALGISVEAARELLFGKSRSTDGRQP